MATVRIGWSAGLCYFEYVGGVGSWVGREQGFRCRVDRRLHVLLGRVDASIEVELEEAVILREYPKLETLVIWVSDGICPNCRSSGVVTAVAIVSALPPGKYVETTMVG